MTLDHHFQSNSDTCHCQPYPLHIQRLTQGRRPAKSAKISKISKSAHPSGPWTAPEIQATIINSKSASAFSFHHQAAAPNQHQLPASTTRQQHHISQPPARYPANQLLTLLPATPTPWQPGLLLFRYPVIIFLLLYFSLSYLHRDKVG